MTALYEDAGLVLDDDGITIRRYYFPFAGPKRIPHRDVTDVTTEQMGWASGKGRLWGATDPRYWFPLDLKRGGKNTLLILDVGSRVTPEDPDRVIGLLKARIPAS
ncbi:hypothetical protein C3477_04810 [Mycobacterium kansasii]|uniref:hypothetical protein n=1 Tax=Mycobacterium kansasii TaxID=1768 RepID=UPI000CDCF220|nr:hypothetical protein [Mycobacterium kansasii]POX87438.1 hypothetical protein C3B43_18010 [Mycobacterium kansasii]POY08294.1 hypothetical protein C3477_04810 [Mycobacterium kansasii]POY22942.1 hypothetical protein C3476_09660 [Mycobacterium kansasii]